MTITPPEKKKKRRGHKKKEEYTSKEFLKRVHLTDTFSLPDIVALTESGVGRVERNFVQEVAMYLGVADVRYNSFINEGLGTPATRTKEKLWPLRFSLEEMVLKHTPQIRQLKDYFGRTVPKRIPTIHHLADLKRDVALLLGSVAVAKIDEQNLSSLLSTREKYGWDRSQQSHFQETYFHYVLHKGDVAQHEAIAEVYNLVSIYDSNPLDTLRQRDWYELGKYNNFGKVMDRLLSLQPKTKEEVQEGIKYFSTILDKCVTHPQFSLFVQDGRLHSKQYVAEEMDKIIQSTNTRLFGERRDTLASVTDFVFHYFYPTVMPPIALQAERFLKEMVEPIAQFVDENKIQYVKNMNLLGASFKEGITQEEVRVIQIYPEQKLALYIKNIGILQKVGLPYHKKYDVKTRKYEKLLKQEFSSLSLEELTQRTALREQIHTSFERDYAGILLQASYNNQFDKGNLERNKKLLEFISTQVRYKELYPVSQLEDHTLFEGLVWSMLGVSQGVDLLKITSLCEIIEKVEGNYIDRKAKKMRAEDNYYTLIFRPLQKISPAGATMLLEKEYISTFVQKWVVDTKGSDAESLSLLNCFMDRTYQLLDSLKDRETIEVEQRYEKWFLELMTQNKVTELKQQLSLGKIVDDLREESARGSRLPLCTLKEEQMVFAKMASVYARSALTVMQTEPVLDHLVLPQLQEHKIALAEFVHCFSTFEENRKVYTFLSFLQAAVERFGYYDLGRKEDNSKRTVEEVMFARFLNPSFATKIWSLLNYTRVLENVGATHPKLAKQFEEVIHNLTPLQQEYAGGSPLAHELGLLSLENRLVYQLDGSEKKNSEGRGNTNREIDLFLQEMIMPLCQGKKDISNEEVIDLTERIYGLIGQKYAIPSTKIEKEGQSERSTIGKTVVLPLQTNAAYAGQDIFYYEEMQGVRQARVIVKEANGVMNDRMNKVRQQHGREIQTIKRSLEAMKPQRVTVKKRMYEGEVDELVHAEMMLDLKSGISPYMDIFMQRQITERDIAILLSINQSKKLGRWINQEHRLMDYVRPAALYLMEATTLVGDTLGVYGYTSRGANEVFINVFKDFDERATLQVEYRLGLLSAQDNARMGVAYQHCTQILTEQVAQRRIHFDILTDITEDEGYKGEQAMEDIARAVRAERSKGIEMYALCTEPEVNLAQLEYIYGSGHFQIVRHYEEMAKHVVDLYKMMTLK